MDEQDYDKIIQERFAELPQAVQDAVTDASVEEKLRALAQKHKLHLDQWVLLENEIMLTLLGLEKPENMVANVAREVNVDKALAQDLVNDIALEVFKPIREQMQTSMDESSREPGSTATRPAQKQNEKMRPSDSAAYKPGESSAQRHDIHDDPYREPIEE